MQRLTCSIALTGCFCLPIAKRAGFAWRTAFHCVAPRIPLLASLAAIGSEIRWKLTSEDAASRTGNGICSSVEAQLPTSSQAVA